MLPPGFVPDKSVIVSESGSSESRSKGQDDADEDDDFIDYDGDGVSFRSPFWCSFRYRWNALLC